MSNEKLDFPAIFDAAAELPVGEQLLFLQKKCNGNEQMIANLMRLLEADGMNRKSKFMEWPGTETDTGQNQGNWIGKQLGNYRVTKLIGEGTSGLVFHAEPVGPNANSNIETSETTLANLCCEPDKETNPKVAIKLLQSWQHDRHGMERFRREAEAIARVNHPCVIRLIEFGTTETGIPFIVMPFVKGDSLQTWIRKQPETPLKVRVSWLIDICDAINATHQELVVHRDLKPSNILIAEAEAGSSRAIVTDFSTAKFVFAKDDRMTLTATGQILGTPGFLAPEQVDGSENVSSLADVYGLGGILYFLLTGRPPFQDQSTFEILKKVKTEQPILPKKVNPDVPLDLQTICLKCLNKKPKQRYQSVTELAADLIRWTEGKPISARPIGKLERAAYWVRRNPITAGLSVFGLVLVATFLVALTVLWQSAETEKQRAEQTNSDLVHLLKQIAETERKHRDDPAKTFARVDMLRTMVAEFEQLEKRGGLADSELLEASATAWYNFLRFDRDISGRFDEKAAAKALAQFAELSERHPETNKYKFDLFHCNHLLRRDDEALRIIRDLVKNDATGNLDYRGCLSGSLTRRAIRHIENGETAQAEKDLSKSISISDQVISESPETRKNHFRYGLARALFWRSRVRYATGKIESAKVDAVRSIENGKQVFAGIPNLGTRVDYCSSLRWMANIHLFEGNLVEAQRLLDEIEPLLPEIRKNANVFGSAWGHTATVLLFRWVLQKYQGDEVGQLQTAEELNGHFDEWKASNSVPMTYASLRGRFILVQQTDGFLDDFESRMKSGEFKFAKGELCLVLFHYLRNDLPAAYTALEESKAVEPLGRQTFSPSKTFESAILVADPEAGQSNLLNDGDFRKLLLYGRFIDVEIARMLNSTSSR